jgi:NTE family protein
MNAAAANPQARVALVIGSGSVKCAAAIGIQKALIRAGIGLDMVVGCSGGAIYAALMAAGHPPAVSAEMTQQMWTREISQGRNRRALLQALAPRWLKFKAEHFGLRDDRLLMARLREAYGASQIEDMKIPLHITATDFSNGELVDISSGSVVDAIRASAALPFAFSPWKIDGKLLVDGFLSDPMPVSVAVKHGASVIVAVGFESPYQESVTSAGRFAFQLSSIMSNNLLKSRFAFQSLAHHSEVLAVMPEFKQRIRLFDTAKVPYIIEEGERAAEEQMPYLKQLLARSATVSVEA